MDIRTYPGLLYPYMFEYGIGVYMLTITSTQMAPMLSVKSPFIECFSARAGANDALT